MQEDRLEMKSNGYSSIVIVVIIVALLAVGVLLFSSKKNTSSPSSGSMTNQTSTKSSSDTLPGFGKIENEEYMFYYPTGYTQAKAENGEVLNYINPNTKAIVAESIFLNTNPSDGLKLRKPTYEICQKFSEALRQKAEDTIKAEVSYGGLGGGQGVGCKVTVIMPIPRTTDSAVIIEKMLWRENNPDSSMYRVRAVFYKVASQSEEEKLELAIDQFALK